MDEVLVEAYLDGGWYVFDARNHRPRVGRVLIARGRDATDVAIANTFGQADLIDFQVISEELPATSRPMSTPSWRRRQASLPPGLHRPWRSVTCARRSHVQPNGQDRPSGRRTARASRGRCPARWRPPRPARQRLEAAGIRRLGPAALPRRSLAAPPRNRCAEGEDFRESGQVRPRSLHLVGNDRPLRWRHTLDGAFQP